MQLKSFRLPFSTLYVQLISLATSDRHTHSETFVFSIDMLVAFKLTARLNPYWQMRSQTCSFHLRISHTIPLRISVNIRYTVYYIKHPVTVIYMFEHNVSFFNYMHIIMYFIKKDLICQNNKKRDNTKIAFRVYHFLKKF